MQTCCVASVRAPAAMRPARRHALGLASSSVPARVTRRSGRALVPRAAAEGASPAEDPNTFALMPSKPKSPMGEMAAYYLAMQPHLFQEAVQRAFTQLKEQREADAAAAAAQEAKAAEAAQAKAEGGSDAGAELVLYQRMAQVKRLEQLLAIEDLMYVCILEKFREVGVDMLPRMEQVPEQAETLKALTEGVHSREALDLVKEHVLAVLGPASVAVAQTQIKMSKLQAAQVYAASIMFGYFLRRVDQRFQLAKQLDMLPQTREDAVARLERLFSQAAQMDEAADPDTADPLEPAEEGAQQASTSGRQQQEGLVQRPKSALRKYVESFDQETMMETARLVTLESATLTERQTQALFGDVKELQRSMQEVVGQDAGSMEEIMLRVQQAVADGRVESMTLTVGTQRRAVLEAIAYGCFLRDVESWVDTDYELLTPISAAGTNGLPEI